MCYFFLSISSNFKIKKLGSRIRILSEVGKKSYERSENFNCFEALNNNRLTLRLLFLKITSFKSEWTAEVGATVRQGSTGVDSDWWEAWESTSKLRVVEIISISFHFDHFDSRDAKFWTSSIQTLVGIFLLSWHFD